MLHSGLLMGNPGITERFATIYGMLEARCDMYVSMSKLSGRLDLLGCDVKKGEAEVEEQEGNAVFYQEGEEDERWDVEEEEGDEDLRQEVFDEMVDSSESESSADSDDGESEEDEGSVQGDAIDRLIEMEAMEVDGAEGDESSDDE
jgi:hypothetical protein